MNTEKGNQITTAKSFRVEDVTHEPRKQFEPIKDSYKKTHGFEPVSKEAVEKLIAKLEAEGAIGVYATRGCIMPLRGSKDSAGYDFATLPEITIKPGEKAMLWTNVKAYMERGVVLLADVRSSAGGLDLSLANTIGVIDSDYHNNPKNEGNIGLYLKNNKPAMRLTGYKEIEVNGETIKVPQIEDLTEKNTLVFKAGERVAQLFFVNFLEADNCNTEAERNDGWGSTGR